MSRAKCRLLLLLAATALLSSEPGEAKESSRSKRLERFSEWLEEREMEEEVTFLGEDLG
jgi:hypothetical protein